MAGGAGGGVHLAVGVGGSDATGVVSAARGCCGAACLSFARRFST